MYKVLFRDKFLIKSLLPLSTKRVISFAFYILFSIMLSGYISSKVFKFLSLGLFPTTLKNSQPEEAKSYRL